MRLECQQIYTENQRLRDEYKQLKQLSSPKKFLELQKEVEYLHCTFIFCLFIFFSFDRWSTCTGS